mgnify:CR=1 FL=1
MKNILIAAIILAATSAHAQVARLVELAVPFFALVDGLELLLREIVGEPLPPMCSGRCIIMFK